MDWVYRISDGVFLRDKGLSGIVAGEAVVNLSRVPTADDRYSGRDDAPLRPATREEIAAARDIAFDEAALAEVQNNLTLRAVTMVLYGRMLQRAPTAEELLALFADVKAVYRTLDA